MEAEPTPTPALRDDAASPGGARSPASAAPSPVLPVYGGPCLTGLVGALLERRSGEPPDWLPEPVRDHVIAGRLSAGHARAIASSPDPGALARAIVERDLSVRDYVTAILQRAIAEDAQQEAAGEAAAWGRLSASAFARDWVSEEDAVYDSLSAG